MSFSQGEPGASEFPDWVNRLENRIAEVFPLGELVEAEMSPEDAMRWIVNLMMEENDLAHPEHAQYLWNAGPMTGNYDLGAFSNDPQEQLNRGARNLWLNAYKKYFKRSEVRQNLQNPEKCKLRFDGFKEPGKTKGKKKRPIHARLAFTLILDIAPSSIMDGDRGEYPMHFEFFLRNPQEDEREGNKRKRIGVETKISRSMLNQLKLEKAVGIATACAVTAEALRNAYGGGGADGNKPGENKPMQLGHPDGWKA